MFLSYVLAILTLLAILTVLATLAVLTTLEKARHIGSASVVSLYHIAIVALFYLYVNMRLFIIPRFAEILPCEYARGSGRPFVGGHSLRATALVECKTRKAVCCGD